MGECFCAFPATALSATPTPSWPQRQKVVDPEGGGAGDRTGLVGKPVEDGVAALLRCPLVTHQGA